MLRAPQSCRGLMTDSVCSAPPQSIVDPHSISKFKLAMMPKNIKPLIENAQEVQVRLKACIAELRLLLTHIHSSPSIMMSSFSYHILQFSHL